MFEQRSPDGSLAITAQDAVLAVSALQGYVRPDGLDARDQLLIALDDARHYDPRPFDSGTFQRFTSLSEGQADRLISAAERFWDGGERDTRSMLDSLGLGGATD